MKWKKKKMKEVEKEEEKEKIVPFEDSPVAFEYSYSCQQ